MPIKLKKTNIQYDIDTPEKGWVILGVNEDGQLVIKDADGSYEKIVKDESFGIYLRLETDYLTIGNRLSDSDEGLYSFVQGEDVFADSYAATAIGRNATSRCVYGYSRGEYVKAFGGNSGDKNGAHVSGSGFQQSFPLLSGGENSFVHSTALSGGESFGSLGDYSVVLGGYDNSIGENTNYCTIIGGVNNRIDEYLENVVVLGGDTIIAEKSNYVYVMNLDVEGCIKVGNVSDEDVPLTQDSVGSTRYKETNNSSSYQMVMKTGVNSFSWIDIITNTW